MVHNWQLRKTSWTGACAGKSTYIMTSDKTECEYRVSAGYYDSNPCYDGDLDAEHYVSAGFFTGGVQIRKLANSTPCGCKESYAYAMSSYTSSWTNSGWTLDSRSYWAWPPDTNWSEWGLSPVYHVYDATQCDNYYTQFPANALSRYQGGYDDAGGSTSKSCPAGELKDSSFNNLCVAYVAADGWVNLNVGCSGTSNCSWSLKGPGGWSITGSGSQSYSKLPSHRYYLTCNTVAGMITNTPTVNSGLLPYFKSHTLTCSYSCDHKCSGSEKQCVGGSGYQQCTTNAQGCRVWSSTSYCNDGVPCTNDSCVGQGACQYSPQNSACNDSNPCTSDTCQSWGCSYSNASGSCTDNNGCTENDYCSGGSCQPGSQKVCNDNNSCTNDSCSNGNCVYSPNSNSCNDGDGCTTSDQCSNGSCVGTPKNCNDSNSCTNDSCVNGNCQNSNNSNSCDDGNSCTQNDQCSGGSCQAGSPKNCDDSNPCTNDACVAGNCQNTPNTLSCNDNNPCTLSDVCSAGVCAGTAKDCNDGNVCTADSCAGGTCQHAPVGGSCNDGNACTTADSCAGGVCTGGVAPDCDDSNQCTQDTCVPATGCKHTNVTGACEDGSLCTVGDACVAGSCVSGAAPDCNDGNLCTDDACNPASGCTNVANAKPCDDGKDCTSADHCDSKACTGTATNCDDGVACTVDACEEGVGCTHQASAVACDDGNPCTDDACNAASGCDYVDNASPCSDANPCTEGDACNSGACLPGGAVNCDDFVECTVDGCDPTVGCTNAADNGDCDDGVSCTEDVCQPFAGCKNTPKSSACDDANECTVDACDVLGGCTNTLGALNCDDNNPCTTDSCQKGVGCVNAPNTLGCEDGNPCTAGDKCAAADCVPGVAMDCDDGNVCTIEYCDTTSGCQYQNQGGPCDDDNACSSNDTCTAGVCGGTQSIICGDGNPCTQDACDPVTGCTYPELDDVPCSDGNPCTDGDTCGSGVCLAGPPKDCGDGSPCTLDSCNPASGCAHTSSDALCDDGVGCTLDVCNGASGCSHTPQAAPCDDANPCTDDLCNVATGCQHTDNAASCTDANACTVGDSCDNGVCQPGSAKPCDDKVVCTTDTCSPASGCVFTPTALLCDDGIDCTVDACDVSKGCSNVADKGLCNDQNECTTDACSPTEGCTNTPGALNCDDGNACTTDSCEKGKGCVHAPNSLACQDSDECTVGDKCVAGACVAGQPRVCDDGNVCTVEYCDSSKGCLSEPQGGQCDDKDSCTVGDVCVEGVCLGQQSVVCGDGNPCTKDSCDAVVGCVYPDAEGVACSDSNPCTTQDTCQSGKCLGGPLLACDDGVACTKDACDAAKGCTATPDDAGCSDGIECTADVCDPSKGCQHQPDNTKCLPFGPCDAVSCDATGGCKHTKDPQLCNSLGELCGSYTCDDGFACQTTAKSCADDNPCTSDACDPLTGKCSHTPIKDCCISASECPLAKGCYQRACENHECVEIPGCLGLEVCAFNSCRKKCNPPKETTTCSESTATLLKCLTDNSTGLSGWVPEECAGTDKCAFNSALDRSVCCTPNCEGKECGAPSECQIPCGECGEGWACAAPDQPFKISGSHPDAYTCVPGCASVAVEVPTESATWTSAVPECGVSLPGTKDLDFCGNCGGGKACFEGICKTACEEEGVPLEGRCSDTRNLQYCEDGEVKNVQCQTEGSEYCCPADAPQNATGRATCCNCEGECEAKGWECGVDSCGDQCGDPKTSDGCATAMGYDCQGRTCVCLNPALCGTPDAGGEDVGNADGADSRDAGNLPDTGTAETGTQQGGSSSSGCSGGRSAPPAPWSMLVSLLIAAVLTRRTASARGGR